jgi:hypothetical protein
MAAPYVVVWIGILTLGAHAQCANDCSRGLVIEYECAQQGVRFATAASVALSKLVFVKCMDSSSLPKSQGRSLACSVLALCLVPIAVYLAGEQMVHCLYLSR